MITVEGHISGIGSKEKNLNVITPEHLSRERSFVFGQDYGVIQGFAAEITDGVQKQNTIRVNPGVMHAFGYVGRLETPAEFTFFKPKTTEIIYVYAEADLSVIPNVFSIKARDNGLREDAGWLKQIRLDEVRTGKFQLLLYKATLTKDGFVSMEKTFSEIIRINNQTGQITQDISGYSYPIGKVLKTNRIKGKLINGYLSGDATTPTQSELNNSLFIANTEFVTKEISREVRK